MSLVLKCLGFIVQYGVQRFVYVSTDKAMNPTNIMGASKRIAEIMVQSRFSAQNYILEHKLLQQDLGMY